MIIYNEKIGLRGSGVSKNEYVYQSQVRCV